MAAFYVGFFGLVGVFARFLIDTFAARFNLVVPLVTGAINAVGSFLAGVLYAYGVEKRLLPADLRVGLQVGLLGGFTTFSAYSIQSAVLLENGVALPGLLYWALSPILGIVSAFGG